MFCFVIGLKIITYNCKRTVTGFVIYRRVALVIKGYYDKGGQIG
jgi:hypothetical protein